VGTDEASELERLQSSCRRQAAQIDTLSETLSTLRRGAKALKAENRELRAENARLTGQYRHNAGLQAAERAEVAA
jgi:regulator of replication initiation timing